MNERMQVFDRSLVTRRRARFARDFAAAGFLVEEVTARLLDRLGTTPVKGPSIDIEASHHFPKRANTCSGS